MPDTQDKTRGRWIVVLRRSLLGVAIAITIAAYGLVRTDVTVDVEYRAARVLRVLEITGEDLAERLVLVDMGDHSRALLISDWTIRAAPGQAACVKRQTLLLRRWNRHSLVLPAHCELPPPPPLPSARPLAPDLLDA